MSDEELHFGSNIPELALDNPLLFSAIIALSAIYTAKTTASTAKAAAEYYHSHCVRLLIDINNADLDVIGGIALATTCLLRSYEILDGKSAYSLHFELQ